MLSLFQSCLSAIFSAVSACGNILVTVMGNYVFNVVIAMGIALIVFRFLIKPIVGESVGSDGVNPKKGGKA